jgi:hypothetical protein
MAFVYRHIRLDKNIPFYIGKANRKDRAFNHNNRNDRWNEITSSCEFEVEIILSDLTPMEALAKEKEFISIYQYESMGGTLCNVPPKLSIETKNKISNKNKGKVAWNKGIKGIKLSIESREKMSKSAKGKKMSDVARQKMSLAKKNISDETRKKLSDAAIKREQKKKEAKNV